MALITIFQTLSQKHGKQLLMLFGLSLLIIGFKDFQAELQFNRLIQDSWCGSAPVSPGFFLKAHCGGCYVILGGIAMIALSLIPFKFHLYLEPFLNRQAV